MKAIYLNNFRIALPVAFPATSTLPGLYYFLYIGGMYYDEPKEIRVGKKRAGSSPWLLATPPMTPCETCGCEKPLTSP